MAIEIERKFLVSGDTWRASAKGRELLQGYLNEEPGRSVRVRIDGESAYLTIKGTREGMRRQEFEYPVPLADAREMLELCRPRLIEKTRYKLMHGGHEWIVDEFHGPNRGLLLAEVELQPGEEVVELPSWVGREVTDDNRYYNQFLSNHPYSGWPRTEKQE